MKKFLDKDFLLKTDTAKKLYNYAENLPIIDYHCHVNPKEIAEDKKFSNITEAWLYGDHYKWRAMRACGVPESHVTGTASDFDKFYSYAKIMPQLLGNPLYHWSHLELQRYFGVDEILSEKTAKTIYDKCNDVISELSVQEIIKRSNVEVICTTDDPDDTLEWHKAIKENGFKTKVLPTFRPDRLLKNELGLSETELLKHLEKRLDYFAENGCKLADHGISSLNDTKLIIEVAKLYKERNIAMQLHFNVVRNANSKMFTKIGADTGFDAICDSASAQPIIHILDSLNSCGKLPKTVLYSLNPSDNTSISALSGCFDNVIQGSAWWFNDSIKGMVEQITTMASVYPIGRFLGMLTDSRSFLSYTRHEYFRRLFCNIVGELVENGEYPNDWDCLTALVKGVFYANSKDFFEFGG